jgi:hypothetical protein
MIQNITIDVSRVPLGLQKHPQCLASCADIREGFSNAKKFDAICLHEAGHMIHFTEMGVPQNGFVFTRPYIDFAADGKGGGRFTPIAFSIEPNLNAIDMRRFKSGEEIALALAKAATAGAVYTRMFTEETDLGNEVDERIFAIHFGNICNGWPHLRSRRDYFYKLGAAEVEKNVTIDVDGTRLVSLAARRAAWEVAQPIKQFLLS